MSALRFVDFTIRAWREGQFVQVIAHSTPAGGMRQPVAVKLGPFVSEDYRLPIDASLAQGAELGRRLARLILPAEVWALLDESLVAVAPRPELGLRLRLCLDDDLIDLPWELLYRPDVDADAASCGFLLTEGRISLVREPPSVVASVSPSDRTRHGVFVGAFFDDGSDGFGVTVEHQSLARAMRPLKGLLAFEFARADDAPGVERAFASGCDVFHYAGHTEVEQGRGTLVQLVRSATMRGLGSDETVGLIEAAEERAPWAWSDTLASRLARGGTRLAVFNACNSGYWPFVRPFMRAGVSTVIGVQGLVSNLAALNFAEKLYQSLAVGLSLDEAITFARLYVREPERSYHACDWARFMAYMPSDAAVLFPRSERSPMRRRQEGLRSARERTVSGARALAEQMDGAGVSRMLSDIAERSVLILGRFSDTRKAVLDALRTALATPPRQYVPLLFDFEKPGDRDLIESIVRYASVSRFVIADLSDPRSIPAELQAIVPQFVSLPVVPIIEETQREYAVSDHILRRESVKPVVRYRDVPDLLAILDKRILGPAEALRAELRPPPV